MCDSYSAIWDCVPTATRLVAWKGVGGVGGVGGVVVSVGVVVVVVCSG